MTDDIKALLQRLRHYGDNDRDAACALIEHLQSELKGRHQRQHDAEALAGDYLLQRDDARAAMQWQPIDTAPKDLTPVLLWLPAVGGWVAGPWRGSWSVVGECWTLHTPLMQDGKAVCLTGNPEPTRWMPLPAERAATKEQL